MNGMRHTQTEKKKEREREWNEKSIIINLIMIITILIMIEINEINTPCWHHFYYLLFLSLSLIYYNYFILYFSSSCRSFDLAGLDWIDFGFTINTTTTTTANSNTSARFCMHNIPTNSFLVEINKFSTKMRGCVDELLSCQVWYVYMCALRLFLFCCKSSGRPDSANRKK